MQPQKTESEKVKMISLFNKQKNKEDRYMLSQQIIGAGKYGKVYKAVHVDKPDVVFAVKVIRLNTEKAKKQCLQELEIIKRLPKCLNLVKIHPQHFESSNNFYIFEEYCDGGTLADEKRARKNNPFTEQQVFDIFFQVVSGFIELRKAGIFHEDIKPENILKKNNLYKITDFGISQLAEQAENSTIRKGTLIYMPPEKLKSLSYVPTSKSQIFSLGITLYEVFFGHPPFLIKKPANYQSYLKMISDAKVKSVQELRKYFKTGSLSLDKLIRIILKMIELPQSKRLSLEQLISYVSTSEPFNSMKVNENFTMNNKNAVFSNKKKYEAIAYSKIYVTSNSNTESLSSAFAIQDQQDSEATLEMLKLYLEFFRNVSSYIQQGLICLHESKESKLRKQLSVSGCNFPSTSDYIGLVSFYFMDWVFTTLSQKYGEILMNCNLDEQDLVDVQIQIMKDSEFLNFELLKLYNDLQIQNIKQLTMQFKEQELNTGEQLAILLKEIYCQIDCVRINFKDDLLALIFLKQCSRVFNYLVKTMNLFMKDGNKKQLSRNLGNEELEIIKKIISSFHEYESMPRIKLEKCVQEQMKGEQEILYDIESNSDEFQILQFEDD